MQTYYRKHVGKNVKTIIIKVARKLLSRTLAVIKTETPYSIGVVKQLTNNKAHTEVAKPVSQNNVGDQLLQVRITFYSKWTGLL